MKKISTVLGLSVLLLVACNSHKHDATTNTSEVDTIKTDSGITVLKNKAGKVLQTYPTATGPQTGKTTGLDGSPSAKVIHMGEDMVEHPYFIEGKLIHGEGGNITLDKIGTGTDIKPLAVQTVNSEERFGFTGSCNQTQLMQLRLPAGNIHFIVKPKDTLDFTMTLEDPGDYVIKGSPESMQLKLMYQILSIANEAKDVVEDRLKNAKNNLPVYSHLINIRPQQYKEIDDVKHASLRKFITKNDTMFVCLLAAVYLNPAEDIDFLQKLDKKMVLRYPASPFYQGLHEKVLTYSPISLGMVGPEIISKTPDDKTIKLSSFRGKVVLLDFWSSYSTQSRDQMPYIRKAYEKYKSKGFEVVGYTIDKDKNEWTKAIAEDKMDWTNISDLLGYQSAGAATYIVNDLPTNFLLDRQGHIVAKNLKGEALNKKLAELMK